MVSPGSSSRRAGKQPRQILPDRAQLQAALDDPSLQTKADAGLAELPPREPLTLAEHYLAADWLRQKNRRPQRILMLLAAVVALMFATGTIVRVISDRSKVDAPMAYDYQVAQSKSLGLPPNQPAPKQARVDARRGGNIEFPIEPRRTPSPPIEAAVFIRQVDGSFDSVDLLQPKPFPPKNTSFFVDAPVDALLQRKALHLGDNQLYVVVGRPAALPRTGAQMEQTFNTGTGHAPAQRTWQIIDVNVRISGE